MMSDSEFEFQYYEPPEYDAESVPRHILRDCYEAIQSHDPWKASRLIDYAHYAKIDLDKHIIVQNEDKDVKGSTLLYIAILNGEVGIAGKLLELGVSPNMPQLPPKNSPNPTPLIAAVEAHSFTSSKRKHLYMRIIEILIRKGAVPHLEDEFDHSPLHYAIEWENWDLCDFLIPLVTSKSLVWGHYTGGGVFREALDCKNDRIALEMIRRMSPTDINKEDNWVLDWHSYYDVPSSPLKLAVESDRLDAVKLLLDKDADTDKHVTLINKAIKNASVRMVKFFLEDGIDVNMKDPTEEPFMHEYLMFTALNRVYDCRSDRKFESEKCQRLHRIIQILHDEGADLTITNKDSKTLFDLVTFLQPSCEALAMLLQLDFKIVFCQQNKENAIKNILHHIVRAKSFEGNEYSYYAEDIHIFEHVVTCFVKVVQMLCTLGCEIPDPHTIANDFPFKHRGWTSKETKNISKRIRNDIIQVLTDARRPLSLKHSCRLAIWEKMNKANWHFLNDMPPSLKTFVQFGEFVGENAFLDPGASIECEEQQFKWDKPYESTQLSDIRMLVLSSGNFYSLPKEYNLDGHIMFSLRRENLKQMMCDTAAEAQEIITAHIYDFDMIYNVIVLDITESHRKLTSTEWCLEDITHLTSIIVSRWPNVKVLVSQALPRFSYTKRQNSQVSDLNDQMKSKISGMQNVSFVEYDLCNDKGIPVKDYFEEDGGHSLSDKGISLVRKTLASTVQGVLGLKPKRL